MTLPTRVRSSFPHSQSLPSGRLHKPLILIHQWEDRRSKNYNPLASKKDTHSRHRFDILACNTFYQNDLQKASSTIMVFHIVLLLLKELTSQQMKFSNGPMLLKCTGLTMAPTILKRLV